MDFSKFKKYTNKSDSLLTNTKIIVKSVVYEYNDGEVEYTFYYDHDEKYLYVKNGTGANTKINLKDHVRKNGKISAVIGLVDEFEEILIDDLNSCVTEWG